MKPSALSNRGIRMNARNEFTHRSRKPQGRLGSRRGSAVVPALLVASLMAMMGLSMLQASLNGSRVVNYQGDEFRLTSAVESTATLATEEVWSNWLQSRDAINGPNDSHGHPKFGIIAFQEYLDGIGITVNNNISVPPTLDDALQHGTDMLTTVGIPGAVIGNPEFDEVNVDQIRILRVDDVENIKLYVTVSASTNRGQGIINPVLNRAIQLVYTIEPQTFDGFDYGILTNNVNCIFCHTVVDSADRYYNTDPALHGTFDKVKVGSLEALSLRDSGDGNAAINDWDADSFLAGTMYVRGKALDHHGTPISNWADQTLASAQFDAHGLLAQDSYGGMTTTNMSPAGNPPTPGENLYIDYPTDYSQMVDGNLPTAFPPPIPDNGGIDPGTGLPVSAGANNRVIDPEEFFAASQNAEGAITAGIINVSDPTFVIDNVAEYADALFNGNQVSLPSVNSGNVILSGTAANPITIDGTVAIDGDLVINGYIKGEGSLVVSGNIYIPTDLQYLDGQTYLPGDTPGSPSGPRTFGISQDGTTNALGLVSGSNIMIGDYLKPSIFTSPNAWDIINGSAADDFNFVLAELSIFNRNEWTKTQEFLPASVAEANGPPANWSATNPNFDPNYLPRYYQFGDGNEIPIYNKADMYWDSVNGAWQQTREAPITWDPSAMTIVDPSDTSNPILYDQVSGDMVAVLSSVTPSDGWITNAMQKRAIEYFEANRIVGASAPFGIDALLYTNNAIFGISHRSDAQGGSLLINGSMVCSDLGVLSPGKRDHANLFEHPPGSPYRVGLRLNYDARTKDMLNVVNPNQVTIKRTLWNPMANIQ